MKKNDEQILKAAIMAAKVEKANMKGSYYRNDGKSFVLSFVYQGTSTKVTVKGEDEDAAKANAFHEVRSWFNKRVRTGWTRAELDKEALISQKHLLFWRDHLDLLPIVQKAAKLEENKEYGALRKFVGENLSKFTDYSPKHLMRMYGQVPTLVHKDNCQNDVWGKEWSFIGDIDWKNKADLTFAEKNLILKSAARMKLRNLEKIADKTSFRAYCRKVFANY